MAEELEEQGGEGLDIRRHLGVVKRRHLHFLIPFFIGWSVVWAASWILPPRYQSSTLILVEQPSMPRDYVTPNVSDDLQQRMQSITQQILSRTNLLHIIDQAHLYAAKNSDPTPDDKVAGMRKNIDIELVRDTRNQITAFNVNYTSGDPKVAQQVTGELTNLFINQNLEVRQQQSEGTTQFLENQLEAAQKDLAAQEERIRDFKAKHIGEMPGQLTSNLQILQGLQTQLQNEDDALNSARQQRVYLQTLADQYRATQGAVKSVDGSPVGLPAIDDQLQKLRAQLADLSSRYTDRHPDVRKLREEIIKNETLRTQILSAMKTKATDGTPDGSSSPTPDTTQVTMLAPIESQLRSNQLEIANREHAIAILKVKVEDYQARLNQEPIREQQLADLTRGYEQSKANYDDLLKKKNESKMATSMELLQQGERFRVLDPPSLPQKPEFPNRLKFCGIGIGVGLAFGLVVAGAFEMFDDRLYTAKELRKLLPMEVVGEIPTIETIADLSIAKRKVWLGWATAAVVFGTILVGSAFSYLRG
ncbi:MAG TPA: XrtA system polysaccharide chain length determinant [Candidatus Sulfotelmatobacter sp.]|nr:XrtA system polysaccharide chain length determinant [Candidatus Sulfotelmatobacter sp.]